MPIKHEHERGNILASTLMVMLAMNLLAVALVQTSMREFRTANFKQINSTIFYLAESCVNDTLAWFGSFNSPPQTLPYTITRNNISNLYDGTESQQMLNQLSKYSYNCTTTHLSVISREAHETGQGENIALKDSYGLSGDLRPTHYYEIVSNGIGPNGNDKRLITIVSVEY